MHSRKVGYEKLVLDLYMKHVNNQRVAFWLLGAYAPIVEIQIPRSWKIRNKNPACISGHFMCVHKVSVKNDVFCGLCKKDNFWCFILTIHEAYLYLFLHKPQKTSLFTETLWTDIKCLDIHAGLLFRIFQLFEMCISTMGAYAPRSQNAALSLISDFGWHRFPIGAHVHCQLDWPINP